MMVQHGQVLAMVISILNRSIYNWSWIRCVEWWGLTCWYIWNTHIKFPLWLSFLAGTSRNLDPTIWCLYSECRFGWCWTGRELVCSQGIHRPIWKVCIGFLDWVDWTYRSYWSGSWTKHSCLGGQNHEFIPCVVSLVKLVGSPTRMILGIVAYCTLICTSKPHVEPRENSGKTNPPFMDRLSYNPR